ncbi:MAG: alpha-mannosidase [Clostridia bacterium]|nr:alpha-mannosidase [Clostridia bacterium]
MTFIKEKIEMSLKNLKKQIVTGKKEIENISFIRCGYKTDNTPPPESADWIPYTSSATAPIDYKKEDHAWFHFKVKANKEDGKQAYLKIITGMDGGDTINPQCTVYVNGTTAVQAFDMKHTDMPMPEGECDIYIYFYAGMYDHVLDIKFLLINKDVLVEKLYYDIEIPYVALGVLSKDSYEYYTILNALDEATQKIDFRKTYSEDYYESLRAAEKYMREEFYGKACGKDAAGELCVVGHTHIDVAWLWTLAQTEEKAQRSFATATKLMEKYPDYIFMSSQPQLYAYVKKNDPELYAKIKERVREGRWETEGAMWLEADTNLAGGESLIRQLLYGKKFMREEFGHENRILWLPDVFGYSAALPQILKKSGVDRFFTTKLSWSETNKQPHDNFIWQGIDGSEVFVVLADSYVKGLDAKIVYFSDKEHKDKKYTNTHISLFGFGDGGGGPNPDMLEAYDRLKFGLPGLPKVKMRKAGETIDIIENQFKESTKRLAFTPKWVGELYLEMHRGTYTTMAHNKKCNRLCEFLFAKAEAASASANALLGCEYPAEKLDECWLTLLKNQFHDIIPGSSIKEVYEDSAREYADLLKDGDEIFSSALSSLAQNIRTEGGYLVYNPTPFALSGVVRAGDDFISVSEVPAHGYAVISDIEKCERTVKADAHTIENDFARVEFDENYHIISFYDKVNRREVIEAGGKGNVFEVFEDYPRVYDAWEITEYYKQKKWIADDVSSVEVINEPLYAGICVKRKYGDSAFSQIITLTADSPRLDFDTYIDWHEDHVMLKAAFPLDVRANHMNCEIQFGHIERPTHRNTSWDQAKFEVCAHKWTDMSEGDFGVALLNDCKYGYSAEENVLKLTLLKAPTSPNPVADRGGHEFTYSLYPHAGTLSQSDVVKEAYALNNPLTVEKIVANENGDLAPVFSFAHTDNDRAVIETIKRAEDADGYIIRLYDSKGTKGEVTLSLGIDFESAYECDMQENILAPLAKEGRDVKLSLSNFEIKTIKITL